MQYFVHVRRTIKNLVTGSLKTPVFLSFLLLSAHSVASAQGTMDPPFSSSSVWNLPISSGATYVSAGFSSDRQWMFFFENIRIHKVNLADPKRTVYTKRTDSYCAGSSNIDTSRVQYEVNLPDSLIYNRQISNGIAVFLFPDGHARESYLWERCSTGSAAAGRWSPSELYSLTGDGLPYYGRQLGSLLPGLGGVIRKGELTTAPGVPIRHALKLVLSAVVMYYNANDPTPGYRWPAKTKDGYASTYYKGTNPAVEVGSLFAIHPRESTGSLGLLTEPGKKIFQALQTYGGYVVDTGCLANGNCWTLGAEVGTNNSRVVEDDLRNAYGITLWGSEQASINFRADIKAIYDHLMVVTNATQQTPKGPGSVGVPAPSNLRVVSQ
jgi:hypothetical protein